MYCCIILSDEARAGEGGIDKGERACTTPFPPLTKLGWGRRSTIDKGKASTAPFLCLHDEAGAGEGEGELHKGE